MSFVNPLFISVGLVFVTLSLFVEKSRSVQKVLVSDPAPSTTAIGLKWTRSRPKGTVQF